MDKSSCDISKNEIVKSRIYHCDAGDDEQNDIANNKEDCDGIHDNSSLGQMHVDVLANVCDMTEHSDDHIYGV